MSTGKKFSYPLLFGLLAFTWQSWGLEPLDHRPIGELAAALKSSGQERIAQGVQGVLAKDAKTGELFTARSLLMLTTNKQTGDWTISVVHDKILGSTALIGKNLQRVSGNEIPRLPTFNRQDAEKIIARFEGWGPAYYPDEMERYAKEGFQRVFTGQFSVTTEPEFRTVMSPVFIDVIIRPSDAGFAVLVVDKSGACAKIAAGGQFSEKR